MKPEQLPIHSSGSYLFFLIRSFDKDKLSRPTESLKPQASVTDDGGIIGALASALLNRNKVIHCSDSSDEGDTDDDDEW